MARSFSSYGSGFSPKSGLVGRFSMRDFNGPPSRAGNAAGIVNLGSSYGSIRGSMTNFSKVSANAIAARASQRATAISARASVDASKAVNKGRLKAAKIQASAQKSAAKSQARGSMIGSAFKAVGTIGAVALMASDESIKDNIQTIDDALTKLRALKPVTFNYKEEWSTNPELIHHGFIAQDYMKVMPDATYYDESSGKYCIDTSELIGLLVRAIQQLEVKVTSLEVKHALAGVK